MKKRTASLTFALLLILTNVAAAQDPYEGRWIAHYVDAQLGRVAGEVWIEEHSQSADIDYVVEDTGERAQVTADITRRQDGLDVTFDRAVLPANSIDLPQWGMPLEADANGRVALAVGNYRQDVLLGVPIPSDDTITVHMHLSPDQRVLSGRWSYSVDPGRDPESHLPDRAVDYDAKFEDPPTSRFIGIESWQRPNISITDLFAIEDQFSKSGGLPNYTYPFAANGQTLGGAHPFRVLFVLGQDLPFRSREEIQIESSNPLIEYRVRLLPADITAPSSMHQSWLEWLDRGWQRLEHRVPPDILADWHQQQVMILEADLSPGVEPGVQELSINGRRVAWLLQFGDWRGSLAITRPLGYGQTEAADFMYPGESFQVEMNLDSERNVTEFPVQLGVITADGNVRHVLVAGHRRIPAQRDPNEPSRYVTDPIQLSDLDYVDSYRATEPLVGILPGETLVATLAENPVVDLTPAVARTEILESPALLASRLSGNSETPPITWPLALNRAAACDGIEGIDPATATNQEVDSFSNVIVTSFTSMSTQVKLGVHAAAIIERDIFLDLMASREAAMRQELGRPALLGFRDLVDIDRNDPSWPIAATEVTAPDGSGKVLFANTYDDRMMSEHFGLQGGALEDYRVEATREVRQTYAEAIRESAESAADIDECEIDDLLELVGPQDFDGIRRIAMNLAVNLGSETVVRPPLAQFTRPFVTTNREVREWVGDVALTARSLHVQRDASSADNQVLLLAVYLVTLPVTLPETPFALEAAWYLSAADMVLSVGKMIYDAHDLSADERFAVGASTVIGPQRYGETEDRRYEIIGDYFNALISAGGLAMEHVRYRGVMGKAQEEAAERGMGRAAEISSLDELGDLSQEEIEEIAEGIIRSMRLESELGRDALESQELAAVELGNEILHEAGAVPASRPAWARDLSDDEFELLGPLTRQEHVNHIFEESPAILAEAIEDPEVRNLLWLPVDSAEEFQRILERYRARAPPGSVAQYGQTGNPFWEPTNIDVRENRYGDQLHLDVYAGNDENVLLGNTIRTLEQRSAQTGNEEIQLVLNSIKLQYAPRRTFGWVEGLPHPLTERGYPLGMYLNLRAMNELGIRFADSRLRTVKVSFILSAETCIELHWLRLHYPEVPVEELITHTHSYQYTENFLEQAHFEVTSAEFRDGSLGAVSGLDYWFGGDPNQFEAFAAGYGLGLSDNVEQGFTFVLHVQPIP